MITKQTFVLLAVLALLAAPAWADWMPGDPYKMHWPQLPDPNGWDVAFDEVVETSPGGDPTVYRGPLADDWQCSETGYVDDIHIWVSFREDFIPAANEFVAGFVEIRSDVPVGPDNPEPYSHPGQVLWGMGFDTLMSNVTMRDYGTGEQGWLEPYNGVAIRPDHQQYFQINIDPISQSVEPFIQRQGDIYWLVSHMMILDAAGNRVEGKEIGWKTSVSPHFMDDAVYGHPYAGQAGFPTWVPIVDPYTGESLDLAFVITGRPVPEPASAVLLLTGLVFMYYATRRR